MLVSKLNIKKYKSGNATRWLAFRYPTQSGIDPVFAGRLAALGGSLGWIITIIRGGVTSIEQKEVGDMLLKRNPTWTKRSTGAIYNQRGQCMVAAPGTSPHEQFLAVDGDVRLEAISNYTLSRFGLCRPMAYEPWHIQPIETKGKNFTARKTLMPVHIEGTLVENQSRLHLIPDGIYGPKTHDALSNELF